MAAVDIAIICTVIDANSSATRTSIEAADYPTFSPTLMPTNETAHSTAIV